MPTASNFSKIINAKGQVSSQFENYARQVAGLTEPKNIFTADMQHGIVFEKNAILALETETEIDFEAVGFISNDEKTAGCSPDAVVLDIIDNTVIGGAEVKCPKTNTHEKYKKDDKIPNIYYPQIMGSIAVCNVDWWWFGSYDAETDDLFKILVKRDDEWIARFWQLIEVFNQKVMKLKKEK